MDIAVHGRHFAVPADLKLAAEEKVANLAKYLEGMERAEVCFFEERNPRIAEPVGCEVTVAGHGHVVRARATGHLPSEAVDRVVDKVAHQLTRLKERLVGRSHPHHSRGERSHGARVAVGLDEPDLEDSDFHENGRRIVRTKQFAIKPMTPDEAVLQMELLSHDFFFFANAETDRPAVVYRRQDGDFGLIDTA
jgi:putative sigma-54 modulation protein